MLKILFYLLIILQLLFLCQTAQVVTMTSCGFRKKSNSRYKVKAMTVLLFRLQSPQPQRPDFSSVPGSPVAPRVRMRSPLPASAPFRTCRIAFPRKLNIKGAKRKTQSHLNVKGFTNKVARAHRARH